MVFLPTKAAPRPEGREPAHRGRSPVTATTKRNTIADQDTEVHDRDTKFSLTTVNFWSVSGLAQIRPNCTVPCQSTMFPPPQTSYTVYLLYICHHVVARSWCNGEQHWLLVIDGPLTFLDFLKCTSRHNTHDYSLCPHSHFAMVRDIVKSVMLKFVQLRKGFLSNFLSSSLR